MALPLLGFAGAFAIGALLLAYFAEQYKVDFGYKLPILDRLGKLSLFLAIACVMTYLLSR